MSTKLIYLRLHLFMICNIFQNAISVLPTTTAAAEAAAAAASSEDE